MPTVGPNRRAHIAGVSVRAMNPDSSTDPATAIGEIARVSRRAVLVSTPWEPVWRLMNLARGRYVSAWGNTPGHIQHFSRRALRRLVSRRVDVLEERRPLPWTVLLGAPRR